MTETPAVGGVPVPPLDPVQTREAVFWDDAAAELGGTAANLKIDPDMLSDPAMDWLPYLGVPKCVEAVLARLPLSGARVLDLGCGMGFLSACLAHRGAHVDAIDVSPRSIEVATARALVSGVGSRIKFVTGPAERLPYEDASFDLVCGMFVLHHLNLEQAVPEITRVLKPGGKGAFIETLGFSPLLMLARASLPGRFGIEKASSDDEAPLNHRTLGVIRQHFPGPVAITVPDFLTFRMGIYLRLLNNPTGRAVLRDIDRMLHRFNAIRKLSYFGVVTLN